MKINGAGADAQAVAGHRTDHFRRGEWVCIPIHAPNNFSTRPRLD